MATYARRSVYLRTSSKTPLFIHRIYFELTVFNDICILTERAKVYNMDYFQSAFRTEITIFEWKRETHIFIANFFRWFRKFS